MIPNISQPYQGSCGFEKVIWQPLLWLLFFVGQDL
jgi:hypothetical protein